MQDDTSIRVLEVTGRSACSIVDGSDERIGDCVKDVDAVVAIVANKQDSVAISIRLVECAAALRATKLPHSCPLSVAENAGSSLQWPLEKKQKSGDMYV